MKDKKHDITLKVLEATEDFKIIGNLSREEAWNKLQKDIYQKENRNMILLGNMTRYAVAASIGVLILVAFTFLNIKKVSTGNGESLLVELPDQSTVLLNASSSISYNPLFWNFNREVQLKGEAFFDVEKGAEFIVWSEEKSVTVLGTSFNIKSREDLYQVACFTGKVKVDNERSHVILTPGEETSELEGNLNKTNFNRTKTATWRTGDFYFESTALDHVVHELERQFDIQVIFTSDTDRIYTGYFNTQSLEEALNMICSPMGLTYTIEEDNKVIIHN